MNISTGIYEQIINRLFKLKLDEVDAERFYIGKKHIAKEEAIRILSKYLQRLIEVAFIDTPEDQDAGKYSDFVNSVIKTLGKLNTNKNYNVVATSGEQRKGALYAEGLTSL